MNKPNIATEFGKALEKDVIPPTHTFLEVELEDGTVARWFIPESRVNDILDCLTTRLGEPETMRL